MSVDRNRKRLAVLIDAENISGAYAEVLFRWISALGDATVRRIYGDFSGNCHKAWDDSVRSQAIDQRQQLAATAAKNASDIAIVIDAMDLLHRDRVDGFCLVSSDSDFTGLAKRLRQDGMKVYGWGKANASLAFKRACNSFYHLDGLLQAEPEPQNVNAVSNAAAAEKQGQKDPLSKVRKLIANSIGEPKDGWETLSVVGKRIRGEQPNFKPGTHGCKSLKDLVAKCGGFELRRKKGVDSVRRKDRAAKVRASAK